MTTCVDPRAATRDRPARRPRQPVPARPRHSRTAHGRHRPPAALLWPDLRPRHGGPGHRLRDRGDRRHDASAAGAGRRGHRLRAVLRLVRGLHQHGRRHPRPPDPPRPRLPPGPRRTPGRGDRPHPQWRTAPGRSSRTASCASCLHRARGKMPATPLAECAECRDPLPRDQQTGICAVCAGALARAREAAPVMETVADRVAALRSALHARPMIPAVRPDPSPGGAPQVRKQSSLTGPNHRPSHLKVAARSCRVIPLGPPRSGDAWSESCTVSFDPRRQTR